MTTLLLAIAVAERQWSAFEPFCDLQDSRVSESSGLAASHLSPGSYYTHNDSGDVPRFFRFTRAGVNAVFTLEGGKAVDWEDMASARIKGKNYLYLGDIGDNAERRESVTVYRLEEPKGQGGKVSRYDTISLEYPDKPHNCEALLVDPSSGDIYLVTKSEQASMVFVHRYTDRRGPHTLRKVGEVKPDTGLGKYGRFVTGGDVSPDGKRVVLRTYSGLLEYAVPRSFQDWWKSEPATLKPPVEVQGEAVCHSAKGDSLLTSSEGTPCPIHVARLEKSGT